MHCTFEDKSTRNVRGKSETARQAFFSCRDCNLLRYRNVYSASYYVVVSQRYLFKRLRLLFVVTMELVCAGCLIFQQA